MKRNSLLAPSLSNHAPLLGLFGGTFDPIHNGHIAVAEGLMSCLPLEEIQFLPCKIPPHGKKPKASVNDRVTMIKKAIVEKHGFVLNDMEIRREGVSYTIETLELCRERYPNNALCLILATDVFSSLNQWKAWDIFLNYCHFIIAERPPFLLNDEPWMLDLLAKHKTNDPDELHLSSHGKILFQNATPSTITSTKVRYYLSHDHSSETRSLLPHSVFDYIESNGLYRN